MEYYITFTSIKYYDWTNVRQWIWMFKIKKHVRGFMCRIFGIYINVQEKQATCKLIKIWQERYNNGITASVVTGSRA